MCGTDARQGSSYMYVYLVFDGQHKLHVYTCREQRESDLANQRSLWLIAFRDSIESLFSDKCTANDNLIQIERVRPLRQRDVDKKRRWRAVTSEGQHNTCRDVTGMQGCSKNCKHHSRFPLIHLHLILFRQICQSIFRCEVVIRSLKVDFRAVILHNLAN